MSYLKENNLKLYDFYVEYWSFVKKFWNVENNEDWWNCFVDDLRSYVNKYDDNDFYVDTIMALYVRNREKEVSETNIQEVKKFFGEYWQYLNNYHEIKETIDYWDGFTQATKDLSKKYGHDPYFIELIDLFFNKKCGVES